MNIIIPILISLATFVGAYKFMPLSWLDSAPTENFGSTITTINGSDTLSNSRTTINTNFSNLNTDKIEATQATLSSLVSIGTITTGVWNASIIPILYGGTGTSTGVQPRGVVFGNGAYGLTVASSTGTTGQFLTSQGANAFPIWQTASVNETSSYNFTGTYFGVKNLNASSTILINDFSYSFPATDNATSSILATNGSGSLSWIKPNIFLGSSNGAAVSTATTTLISVTLPANIMDTGSVIRVTAQATSSALSGAGGALYQHLVLNLGGYGTTTCGLSVSSGSATTTYNFFIRADSATSQSLSCNQTFSGTARYKNNLYQLSDTGGANAEPDYSLAKGTAVLSTSQLLTFDLGKTDTVQNGLRGGTVFGITAELLSPGI